MSKSLVPPFLNIPAWQGLSEMSYKHPRWWMQEAELREMFEPSVVEKIMDSRSSADKQIIDEFRPSEDYDKLTPTNFSDEIENT